MIAGLFLFVLTASAQYAQLSSSSSAPSAGAVVFDQIDLISNVDFTSGESCVNVEQTGAYFVVAAPQVGAANGHYTFDCWLRLNGAEIANSNVRLVANPQHKDVIITQGIVELEEGDCLEVMTSGNAVIEAIPVPGEPLVPSIIFSMFKVEGGKPGKGKGKKKGEKA